MKSFQSFQNNCLLLYRFAYDHPYLSKINWKSSKRLIHGSLLCFSDDGFQNTALFAVIAESDPEKIKKGESNSDRWIRKIKTFLKLFF